MGEQTHHPDEYFAKIEENLGYLFRDNQLLRLAITYGGWNKARFKDYKILGFNSPRILNHKLEFLGDALVRMSVAMFLNMGGYFEADDILILESNNWMQQQAVKLGIEGAKGHNKVETLFGAVYLDSDNNMNLVYTLISRILNFEHFTK